VQIPARLSTTGQMIGVEYSGGGDDDFREHLC